MQVQSVVTVRPLTPPSNIRPASTAPAKSAEDEDELGIGSRQASLARSNTSKTRMARAATAGRSMTGLLVSQDDEEKKSIFNPRLAWQKGIAAAKAKAQVKASLEKKTAVEAVAIEDH